MAKISTFSYNFNAGLDPVVWESVGSPTTVNGRLAIAVDSNAWQFATTWQAYDLTASSVFLQMFPPPGVNLSTIFIGPASARNNWDYAVEWTYNFGNLYVSSWNASALTTFAVGSYDPAVYGRLFRVRHVSGQTLAFDTSVDGVTWTQRTSVTVTWDLTNVVLSLRAGGLSSGEYAYFDNVNTTVPAPSVTTVWSSEVDATSLSVGWTTSNATYARAVLSTASSLSSPVYSPVLIPGLYENVSYRFTGLAENTLYYVGLEVNGTLLSGGRGNYRTARIGLSNSTVAAGSSQNTGSTHAVFTRIKTEAPDFFTHMGDLHRAGTNVESTWRAAFKSSLESSTLQPMLSTVTMTYDWDDFDTGGPGSDKGTNWAAFAPQAVRELTGSGEYVDSRGLYRTWIHAGVRYIELDRWTFRDNEAIANSPSKTMLGTAQRDWLINLLKTASESAIVLFAGFPHYGTSVSVPGRWSSYPDERTIIGDVVASLSLVQKSKIVVISGDSNGVHADDGANTMWGLPNLCASPLNQSGGLAPGTWNIGNIDVDDTRGYFSRLAWTYTQATSTLGLVWSAVQDDGTVMLTWSKSFSTIGDRVGFVKDPAVTGGKRAFIRHRNPSPTPQLVDGGGVVVSAPSEIFDGLTPTPATNFDSQIDGGGVSG